MYAKRAAAIGSRPVGGFDYIPPKFHVVIDFSDPTRHKNVHSFNKNVLPLLQLAGLNVIVKLAADETEVRSFTKEADLRNCSGVAIVGSKKYAEPGFLDEFFADNRPALAIFDLGL
jgi:hypothetical protein